MRRLWPELMVLVLFLTGDILWNGMASAAAGAAAGLVSFLVLLLFHRRKPGLLLEGLLFGGVTALGTVVSFPGGTVILMELLLGVILLSSSFLGLNIMERMAGGLGKGLVSASGSQVLSVALGSVFTVHAAVYALLVSQGSGGTVLGIALFTVLYLGAIKYSSRSIRKHEIASLPTLSRRENGVTVLLRNDEPLGEFKLTDEGAGTAAVFSPVLSAVIPEFLKALGSSLKQNGFRWVVIHDWAGDELELEIDGFTSFDGKWKKRLQ